MKNQKILICDYDGTIMDTSESIIAGMIFTFGKLRPDIAVDSKTARTTIGKSLNDSFDIISNGKMTEEEKIAATQLYRENHSNFSEEFSKPFECIDIELRKAKDNGVKLYVVSNKGEKALHSDLKRFGMLDLFEKILGDESAKEKKPNPEVFERNIKERVEDNAELFVFGDTEIDIKFAQAISAKSIYAKYGYGNNEKCESLRPDFIISKSSELANVMKFHE